MLPNTPEMVEAHYAVPALNAVLNTLNTRLDAPLLAWQMNHCEAQVLITDREFAPVDGARRCASCKAEHGREPVVIDVCDSEYTGPGERAGHARVRGPAGRARAAAAAGRPGRRVGCHRRQLHQRHHRRPEGRGHAPPRRLPQRGVQRGHLDHAALPDATCGRCRCSTATAGASRGRWRCSAARTSACAGWRRQAILDGDARARRRPLLRRADRAQPADQRAGRAARRHHAQGARHGGRRGAAGGDDRGHGQARLRHHPCLRPDRGLRPGGGGGEARRAGRARACPSRRG